MHSDAEWLHPAWMQHGLDALKATVDTDPDLKRQMIEFLLASGLWDASTLTFQSALSRFNNCLNPGKPDFFKTMHLWALMKRFERFDLFHAMADDLGFDVRPRPTVARHQALLERLAAAIEESNRIAGLAAAGLAHMTPPAAEVRVHPALREGGAFGLDPDPSADPSEGTHEPGGF